MNGHTSCQPESTQYTAHATVQASPMSEEMAWRLVGGMIAEVKILAYPQPGRSLRGYYLLA